MELLARTGVGRDINRHFFRPGEVVQALAKPVVQDLLGLIRLRSHHPAFDGRFDLEAATTTACRCAGPTRARALPSPWISGACATK